MARRKRKKKHTGKDERATQHKEKDEHATLLELVIDEDIYLGNYYGFLFDMAITCLTWQSRGKISCANGWHMWERMLSA